MALAPLYPVPEDHPALTKTVLAKGEEARLVENVLAERVLGLKGPAYTGADKDSLILAVAIQMNFQVEQGLSPDIHKTVNNTQPGMMTAYRNRQVSPDAWRIVSATTGVQTIGFSPPGIGV